MFCFVKDYDNRSYCFRLYDLKVNRFAGNKSATVIVLLFKARQAIYEETVPAVLRLEKALDVFYTFDGSVSTY